MKNLFKIVALIFLVTAPIYFSGCGEVSDTLNPDDKTDDVLISDDTNKPGDTLWTHYVPQEDPAHYIGSTLAIGTDGTLYYEASGGQSNWDPVQIYAVNKSDGSLKWKSNPLMSWHINGFDIMVGDNGNIYVASEYKLYSINPIDGSFNWVWEVPSTLQDENGNDVYTYGELGAMALSNNNDIIIKTTGGGSYYRALYRIGNDGTMKWYRFIGAEGTPIAIGKDGTIFDYEHANGIVSLTATNPENGSLIWSILGNSLSGYNNIMIAGNGDLITKTSNDTLVRINPSNGSIVWSVSEDANSYDKYMDANENIIVYDQFTGSDIYNSINGSLIKGELSLPHDLAIDSKNQIYGTLSDYNPILSVTNEDGNVTWQYEVGQVGYYSPVISDDNVVYWITGDNKIVALKTDAGLAHSGWPKFSHDKRNTFNVNKW